MQPEKLDKQSKEAWNGWVFFTKAMTYSVLATVVVLVIVGLLLT